VIVTDSIQGLAGAQTILIVPHKLGRYETNSIHQSTGEKKKDRNYNNFLALHNQAMKNSL
jgi:hypothetical protein